MEVCLDPQKPMDKNILQFKKKATARRAARKLVAIAAMEIPRKYTLSVAVSDQVERVGVLVSHPQEVHHESQATIYNGLVVGIAERLAIPRAILNYARFYHVPPGDVAVQEIRRSSAGINGWSEAFIEEWRAFGPEVPS